MNPPEQATTGMHAHAEGADLRRIGVGYPRGDIMADNGAIRSFADFALRALVALAFIGLGTLPSEAVSAASPPDDGLASLHFRHLGPIGNRADAVVGVPGDPSTLYYGAASGGIWKSEDGGVHFKPVSDATNATSIGALALAPSDPNIVWAGTGESYIIRAYTGTGDVPEIAPTLSFAGTIEPPRAVIGQRTKPLSR